MIDILFEKVLETKEKICVPATEDILKEILELVKEGELKPTVLANPVKGKVSLYKPVGEGRIHITVDEDKICAHYDRYDPARNPVKHLLSDTEVPKMLLALAIAVIGLLIKKRQKGRG